MILKRILLAIKKIFSKKVVNGFSRNKSSNKKNFIEMNDERMNDLYKAINEYIERIKNRIDCYDFEEKLLVSYKGDIQKSVRVYLEAYRELLKAYVGKLDNYIVYVQKAYGNYLKNKDNNKNRL